MPGNEVILMHPNRTVYPQHVRLWVEASKILGPHPVTILAAVLAAILTIMFL